MFKNKLVTEIFPSGFRYEGIISNELRDQRHHAAAIAQEKKKLQKTRSFEIQILVNPNKENLARTKGRP